MTLVWKGILSIFVVQLLSCVWLLATLWTAAHQASLSITVSQSLLRFMSIELVMLSHHLLLCFPLLLPSIFPSIRVSSNESALCIRWPEHWTISFSASPSSEHWGLISFRVTALISLESEGLKRVFSTCLPYLKEAPPRSCWYPAVGHSPYTILILFLVEVSSLPWNQRCATSDTGILEVQEVLCYI